MKLSASNDSPAMLGGIPVFKDKIPLVRPSLPPATSLVKDTEEILRTGMVTKGQFLSKFERAVAEHLEVKHAVAVSSCTSGLMLAYQALGLGGEVIVPSFTFMATVSALIWAGAKPKFVDVDPETWTLDIEAAKKAITPQTRGIVAVHNFGCPANIDAFVALAERHKLKLVFDAAHGFGSLYKNKPVGSQGDAQVFSLSPTKLLIAGEGGIVATNNDQVAEKIRIGREYGNAGNYDSAFAGLNARMPEFSALMGLKSLAMLETAATQRNATAARFRDLLGGLPGISFQRISSDCRSSYKDISITVDADKFGIDRDMLATALGAEGVDSRKYYDPPVHRHTAYRGLAPKGLALPETERLAAQSLSLPIWSKMDDGVIDGICKAVVKVHAAVPQLKSTSVR